MNLRFNASGQHEERVYAREMPRSIAFNVPISTTKPRKKSVLKTPAAKPALAKPNKKPAWNDNVNGSKYFDNTMEKNQLLKEPKKYREMTPKKAVVSVYAGLNKPKTAPPKRTLKPPVVPKVKTKPALETHWSRWPPTKPSVEIKPPEPQLVIQSSPLKIPSPKQTSPFQKSPKTFKKVISQPESPVRRSSNQEDKDDDVAFRSIPPPIHDIPSPNPIQRKLIVSTFKVLDTKRRGYLQAQEIHQGLQLLGITSTLRQIHDYLYLVNDGQGDGIGLNEWIILVNTLQSAEWLTEDSPLQQNPPTPLEFPSPLRSVSSVSVSPPRPTTPAPPLPVAQPSPIAQAPSFQESWFIDQIERRINDMFERAESAVAMKRDNQHTEQPENFLRRAALVVHGLKSSLYPLVHQAEETLREIQTRHAGNLTVFLSPNDMQKIMNESEVLCDMLLDDLLLDMVELLKQDERVKATEVWKSNEQEQIDHLLHLIEAIEADEDQIKLVTSTEQQSTCCLPLPVLLATSVPDIPLENSPAITTMNYNPELDCYNTTQKSIEIPWTIFKEPIGEISTKNVERLAGHLELYRTQFLRSRKIAEATLIDTGFDQPTVIEILENMLLDDVVDELAMEFDDCFSKFGEKILHTI